MHEKWEPMHTGGLPHDTTPIPRQPHDQVRLPPFDTVFTEQDKDALLAQPPAWRQPPPVVKYRYGPFIMAALGLILALIAVTLALYVYDQGCHCPTSPTTTVSP